MGPPTDPCRARRAAAGHAMTAGVLGVLAAAVLGACSTPVHAPSDEAFYIRVPLANGEVAQPGSPVRVGDLLVQLLVAQCGIHAITGTHAEFVPKDPLCRVRMRVVSDDSSSHSFSTREQLLVLDDGTTVPPSYDAMSIKRQPRAVELGANNAAEVEVWWPLAAGHRVAAVRLVGVGATDLTGAAVDPAARVRIDVPLAGL